MASAGGNRRLGRATRQENRLNEIQEQVSRIEMSTSTAARQALLTKTTTRAFAGTIPADQYEPGDDLNITREAHLALLLHHIKSMISDDAEHAPVHQYITNAISYYKLANETKKD